MIKKPVYLLVVLLWTLTVCFLWRFYHWGQMNYHEQLQLFLFSSSFFQKTILSVGGLADYVSQFLVQFFVNHWAGAVVVAILVSAVQLLSFSLIKRINRGNWGVVLSFVPSIAAYCVMGVAEAQLTSLVALVIGLLCAKVEVTIRRDEVRYISLAIISAVVYLLAGSVALLVTMLSVVAVDCSLKRLSIGRAIVMIFAIFIEWVALISLSHIFGEHRIVAYLQGLHYLRTPMQISVVLYINVALVVISILLANIKLRDAKAERMLVGGTILAIVALGIKASSLCYRSDVEEMLRYDYLCRQNAWGEIIAMADDKVPMGISEQNYLNLALAKKGLITQKAFQYRPKGPESLYVPFERHQSMSISAGEVFYHLGLTHIARRYFCESQGAMPNHNLSVRYTKRLAEIDMINGDMGSAAKYLRVLQKTLFYKDWATEQLGRIASHSSDTLAPEYAEIRSRLVRDNFLSSDDYATVLEELVKQHPYDSFAWNYYLMHHLFDKRVDLFIKAFEEYARNFQGEIPQVYQEATLISWLMSYKSLKRYPYTASRYNIDRLQAFMSTYNSQANAEKLLELSYSNTVWYYLFFY